VSDMRHLFAPLLAFLVLSTACGSSDYTLAGEWRFADIRNATSPIDSMTPPLFDVIVFGDQGDIRLNRSLMNMEFRGKYTVVDWVVKWSFQPPDAPRPIEHGVHCSWLADGALVLRGANAKDSSESTVEWVYYRPNRFLPNDGVAGEWQLLDEDGTVGATRSLLVSGVLAAEDGLSWGRYRLWNSGSGLMLTTLLWVQGSGAYATFEKVRFHESTMVLAGRTPPSMPQQPPQVWHRRKGTQPG